MPDLLETDVDGPPPPATDAPDPGDDGGGGGIEPWWHSGWRLAVLGLALVLLGAAASYAWTTVRNAPPGAGSVDVGFLQDMRLHHDQAVGMAMTYRDKGPGQDAGLRLTANEVLLGQQFENGAMAQLLRSYGQTEANTTGTAMGWMGMPVAADRMPGMAAAEDLQALQRATGRDADVLFAKLLIAHHEGGLHMADFAAAHASDAEVRSFAASMARAQRGEINELNAALARLGA